MKITEAKVQNELVRSVFPNHEIRLPNCGLFGWECDLVSVTKAGISHEFEIKTSRSDWLAELRSIKKHMTPKNHRAFILENSNTVESKFLLAEERGWRRVTISCDQTGRKTNKLIEIVPPNYWWVVAPKGVVKDEELPSYAGLIEYEFNQSRGRIVFDFVTNAPKLHKLKLSNKQWRSLGRGAALRLWSLREKMDD